MRTTVETPALAPVHAAKSRARTGVPFAHVARMHRVEEQERALERKRLANDVRSTLNWLAVFRDEYDLPDDVVLRLRERLEAIGERLARI